MTTKQTSPTPEQIREYMLIRWVEGNYPKWKVLSIKYTHDGEYTIHYRDIESEQDGYCRPKIDRTLFAELPMGDEFQKGKFLDHLCKLVGYNMGFTDDADIIIHCIKAPIDQLLLAYYLAGNE